MILQQHTNVNSGDLFSNYPYKEINKTRLLNIGIIMIKISITKYRCLNHLKTKIET